jgi:glycosyltransferase involved in cell wall biosynthesis
MTTDRIHLYNIADTLVIQRPSDSSTEPIVKEAKERGVKIIYELDDNIWDIPKWNLAYPFWTPMRVEISTKVLKLCNRAVTTTEHLANIMRQFNDDVMVVPNAIFDYHYLDLPQGLKYNAEIMIAWVGSSFHKKDTKVFSDLIPKVLDKYKEVGFLFMGESPTRDLQPYAGRIVSLPFVEPIYYHQILNNFRTNIGLAPILDCEFNKSKSPIKLIEYLYKKTFPICSELEPYVKISKEKENLCMLIPTYPDRAGNIDDWMDAIDYCIKNLDTINSYAEEGREFVKENYNIESDKMVNLYKKAYFLE